MTIATCHRVKRGGTLLEVMVSLVIVTLIASSLVEAAAQRRRAGIEETRTTLGRNLVLSWRAARVAGLAWAAREEGDFPEPDHAGWTLAPLKDTVDGSVAPDDHWKELVIQSQSGDVHWVYVLRIDDASAGGP
jgi:prepilin-type N-terminal cleavage/methylation domain-containing protein